MNALSQVTSDPLQSQKLSLPDSSLVQITMYFVPNQNAWFFTNITYGNFVLNSLRICNSPNLLRQFKNIIPFGLACYSTTAREPSLQQDFSSGASTLYLMNEIDVAQYEQIIAGVPFWVNTTTYTIGFLVTYLGQVYVSLTDGNLGNNPGAASSTAWSVYP